MGRHIAWFGGNVVFQATDRGEHWTAISPDLTRNIKEHQLPAGGPLAHDVSGAEYSDTILDIEGSPLNKGEIWVGTDDGARAADARRRRALAERHAAGRAASTRASKRRRRRRSSPARPTSSPTITARATTRRTSTSRTTTARRGRRSSTACRPISTCARFAPTSTIRTSSMPGTENGLWISYDGGAHWQNFRLNLPPVSVRDIRIQPQFNDLVIATHGRDVWILDDATSVQQLPRCAERRRDALRAAHRVYVPLSLQRRLRAYTRFAGDESAERRDRRLLSSAAQKARAAVQILDASGKVIRTIKGTHKVEGKDVPNVPNKAGINRFVWDFHEDGPTQWMGAAHEEYRGPKTGPVVVPGTYTVRMTLGGKTLSQTVDVKPDPRDSWTQADYQAGYDFAKKYNARYGKIDEALNNLDAIKKSLVGGVKRRATPSLRRNREGAASVAATSSRRSPPTITTTKTRSNVPARCVKSVPRTGFGAAAAADGGAARLCLALRRGVRRAFAKYNDYVTSLQSLSKSLQAAGVKPIEGAKPVTP